jgi:hypothetical protein
MNDWHESRTYTASALYTGLTTSPAELMSLIASSLARVSIISLEMSQTSTLLGAKGSVEIFRGSSASTGGSTGAAITPVNKDGWAIAPASTSQVTGNSTVLNSTTNSVRLYAGAFDAGSGQFCWKPDPAPNLDITQRWNVRWTPLTTAELGGMAVTLTYREGGKVPL